MTEKLTRITLPGSDPHVGLMDWGELSAENMIGQFRRHAAHLRAQAEIIEAATDEDFAVDVVRGAIVSRHIRTIQAGRAKP